MPKYRISFRKMKNERLLLNTNWDSITNCISPLFQHYNNSFETKNFHIEPYKKNKIVNNEININILSNKYRNIATIFENDNLQKNNLQLENENKKLNEKIIQLETENKILRKEKTENKSYINEIIKAINEKQDLQFVKFKKI